MIDKSSLLKSQGSLYLEFIPKDGLFHKMLLLSLMGSLTDWCNLIQVVRSCRKSFEPVQNLSKPNDLPQVLPRYQDMFYDLNKAFPA